MPRPAPPPFATGLRNPTALTIQPGTGQLWAVVNERDELGPNLVPDYLTSVREGALLRLALHLLGPECRSARAAAGPGKVARGDPARLQPRSHHAPLGSPFPPPAMGARFADGAFVGEHGSWNRETPVGYKVVFVPFRGGRPAGPPVDFVTGFQADGKTFGRPVGVTVDPRGALIVARPVEHRLAGHAGPAPADAGLDLLQRLAAGFLEEQQRDDHRNRGEEDRVPQAA